MCPSICVSLKPRGGNIFYKYVRNPLSVNQDDRPETLEMSDDHHLEK